MAEPRYPLFDRPPQPPVAILDPSVPDDEIPRLSAQHVAIADALREGPKTNLELGMIAQRFGARLMELKRAGFLWKRSSAGRGIHRYEMVRDFLKPKERL